MSKLLWQKKDNISPNNTTNNNENKNQFFDYLKIELINFFHNYQGYCFTTDDIKSLNELVVNNDKLLRCLKYLHTTEVINYYLIDDKKYWGKSNEPFIRNGPKNDFIDKEQYDFIDDELSHSNSNNSEKHHNRLPRSNSGNFINKEQYDFIDNELPHTKSCHSALSELEMINSSQIDASYDTEKSPLFTLLYFIEMNRKYLDIQNKHFTNREVMYDEQFVKEVVDNELKEFLPTEWYKTYVKENNY